jgi:hypothetical protein
MNKHERLNRALSLIGLALAVILFIIAKFTI